MLQRSNPRLILASASAPRRALLTAAGLTFTVQPADIDEAELKRAARSAGVAAQEAALQLADAKAQRVARCNLEALVIGADQILVCDGAWFDKPENVAAARAQLRALRGRSHVLATAVVCWQRGQRVWHHSAEPLLSMREFTDDFLETYLAVEGDSVTSTVGSYRLEGCGVQLFARVEGEQSAVLGLPLLVLLEFLRQSGVLAA
jgi:septum formation protein